MSASPSHAVAPAVLVDTKSRHQAGLFGQPAMLGFTHTPLDVPPVAGVVICSSLHADFIQNYRKEVLLSRALSARGLAVQRFHYRGSGNSSGSAENITFESLRDDALAAAEQLRTQAEVPQVAFLGTRFGALVAAAAAATSDGPLVLWEPVLRAEGYFREAFRARMIRELKQGAVSAPSIDPLLEELRSTGSVEVLGYTIHRSLYESSVGKALVDELGKRPRPVLLVQISRASELRSDLGSLVSASTADGLTFETRVLAQDQPWWFAGEDWQPEEERVGTSALLTITSDWLARVVGQEGPA